MNEVQNLRIGTPGKTGKYTRGTVLEAIKGSGGIISTISKRLGCAWHTGKTYIQRWKDTEQAFENELETVLDMAESKLYEAVQMGDTQAAKWLLSTRGKKRGYGESLEVAGPGAGPIIIKFDEGFRGL